MTKKPKCCAVLIEFAAEPTPQLAAKLMTQLAAGCSEEPRTLWQADKRRICLIGCVPKLRNDELIIQAVKDVDGVKGATLLQIGADWYAYPPDAGRDGWLTSHVKSHHPAT
jgi:hypothetical protein